MLSLDLLLASERFLSERDTRTQYISTLELLNVTLEQFVKGQFPCRVGFLMIMTMNTMFLFLHVDMTAVIISQLHLFTLANVSVSK